MVTGYPVTVTVAGIPLNCTHVALPLTIVHGRSAVGTQPDPPTCSFTWLGATPPGALGASLYVDVATATAATYDDPVATYDDHVATYDSTSAEVAAPRFRGHIAGLHAVEDAGSVTSWDVDGVGALSRLGYTPVVLDRPAETDVARVAAIEAYSGDWLTIVGDPGPTLAATSIDQDTLAAIHDVAASSGGLLWQAPDGTMMYGTGKHRTGDPVGTLPCEIIGDGVDWDQQVEQIINHVTVTYGPADARAQHTFYDPDSISQPWSRRHVDVDSLCATQPDADQLAQLILHRNASKFWSTPSAMVYGSKTSPADSRTLAALDVGAVVLVPIPNTPGPTPAGLRAATVEGWVEEWDADDHTVQVALSDTARWVATRLRTYGEAMTGGTYAYWKANGTYMDMLIVEGVPT